MISVSYNKLLFLLKQYVITNISFSSDVEFFLPNLVLKVIKNTDKKGRLIDGLVLNPNHINISGISWHEGVKPLIHQSELRTYI